MKKLALLLGYCIIALICANTSLYAATPAADIRLYALNCGTIDLKDISTFAAPGFYKQEDRRLTDPCFLIKHDNSWLLWDTGLGDQYAEHPDKKEGVTLTETVPLVTQLKQLNLVPNDIQFVALSHSHFDHTGNVKLFPKATWLLQDKEYQYLQQQPLPPAVLAETFVTLKDAPKRLLKGDYDVFGDGSVKILSTPGHTPGHQSLEVTLPHHGVLVLSGDLYHLRRNYDAKQMPPSNVSRAETLASMQRVDDLLKKTHGKLIIQHEKDDFATLPQPPKYWD